jgi:hypothetical protein
MHRRRNQGQADAVSNTDAVSSICITATQLQAAPSLRLQTAPSSRPRIRPRKRRGANAQHQRTTPEEPRQPASGNWETGLSATGRQSASARACPATADASLPSLTCIASAPRGDDQQCRTGRSPQALPDLRGQPQRSRPGPSAWRFERTAFGAHGVWGTRRLGHRSSPARGVPTGRWATPACKQS